MSRLTVVIFLTCVVPLLTNCGREAHSETSVATNVNGSDRGEEGVQLSETQMRSVSVQPVGERVFVPDRETPGNIDFNEDMTVQVSPAYAGRIARIVAKTGDHVKKGQLLFTIDSPDLLQAESTLIGAAGVLKLDDTVLERARSLYAIQGLAQKDYEQAISDQQAAEGAYKAAHDAVLIFGKSEADIVRMVREHKVDPQMPVFSPIDGAVVARNAALGMLVQPGAAPAPYTVAELTQKWLLANVSEEDLPALKVGQEVDVKVLAYPDRIFRGRISNIAEAIDPTSRRATVRSEVSDPGDELRAQMFATFTVHVGNPVRAPAVPLDAIVREGDGSMSVWVATDQRRFTRRTVTLGQQTDGFEQIVAGVQPGEQVAARGALFISNASVRGSAD